MHSKVAIRVRERRQLVWRILPWLPLALLLFVVLAGALGIRLTPISFGANPEQVIVTGSVDKEIHLVPTCAGAAALNLGSVVPDDPAVQTAANCSMTFGTDNSAAGADLVINEDPASPAGNAMKCVATCGADTIADYEGVGMPAAPASAFSIRLDSIGGAAAAIWTINGDLTGQMYDVQDAADLACQTSSLVDGTCSFRFAAQVASVSDAPGSYQALVQATALAR